MTVRVITIVIAVPLLLWALVSRLLREVAQAPKYAWWDAQSEFNAMRRAWRAKSTNPEDWK